jgi:hypothetical protein
MLKELNKHWTRAQRQVAAWRRWYRKRPHNRVSWPRLRDQQGRLIGYGPPVPIPEPTLPSYFCRTVELPSGSMEVILADGGIEAAYRLARHPGQTAAEVTPLPISEDEIRRQYER